MLSVHDIKLHYGKKQVLNGVSFQLNAGECIGILGTNGCGKSTLLKILAGALPPTAGNVCYNGIHACLNRHIFRNHVGYVPQDNPLMEDLTVRDNLRLWYADSTLDLKRELDQGILHMLELHTVLKAKVHTLSGGMKKRLSIGCALANQPSVLILDEPTVSLDLPCKEEIRSFLQLYLENGGAIVITTHDVSDFELCNKLFALKNGILEEIPGNIRGKQLTTLISDTSDRK